MASPLPVDKFTNKFSNAVSKLKSDDGTVSRLYNRRARRLNKKSVKRGIKKNNNKDSIALENKKKVK